MVAPKGDSKVTSGDQRLPAEIERKLFKTFLAWLALLGTVLAAVSAGAAYLIGQSVIADNNVRARDIALEDLEYTRTRLQEIDERADAIVNDMNDVIVQIRVQAETAKILAGQAAGELADLKDQLVEGNEVVEAIRELDNNIDQITADQDFRVAIANIVTPVLGDDIERLRQQLIGGQVVVERYTSGAPQRCFDERSGAEVQATALCQRGAPVGGGFTNTCNNPAQVARNEALTRDGQQVGWVVGLRALEPVGGWQGLTYQNFAETGFDTFVLCARFEPAAAG